MSSLQTGAPPQTHEEAVITNYAQGCAILKDHHWTARPGKTGEFIELYGPPGLDALPALMAAFANQVLFADEATHQRLRMVLDGPLRDYSVRLKPFIAQTVIRLINVAKRYGVIDLERDFAVPLTTRVMAQLIGWPKQWLRVREMAAWATAVLHASTGHQRGQSLAVIHQEMVPALRELLAIKRVRPTDDLASIIANNLSLSETEQVVLLLAVFSAGGSTTTATALINGMPLLLTDTQRLATLRTELREGRASLTCVVEELLRLVTPTHIVRRWAVKECTLKGETLRAGCSVQVHLAAMNRDPGPFPHPEVFNWKRGREAQQVAFGKGKHACPGAPLALLVLRVAVDALLALPGLRLVSQGNWNDDLIQPRLQQVLLGVSSHIPRKEAGNVTSQ